jgi:hypothetical protein
MYSNDHYGPVYYTVVIYFLLFLLSHRSPPPPPPVNTEKGEWNLARGPWLALPMLAGLDVNSSGNSQTEFLHSTCIFICGAGDKYKEILNYLYSIVQLVPRT